ncbi:MAG TPA: hypothetical protein VF616_05230 [Duganella sp.]|uniref:hypothetical protein n=1 Tax=Duganella sp. TaxID=1904440 RepID=UPI002ED27DB3
MNAVIGDVTKVNFHDMFRRQAHFITEPSEVLDYPVGQFQLHLPADGLYPGGIDHNAIVYVKVFVAHVGLTYKVSTPILSLIAPRKYEHGLSRDNNNKPAKSWSDRFIR